ncbi:MAG: hypothetical protein ABFD24_11030 [Anaerolineaceae bacterium]
MESMTLHFHGPYSFFLGDRSLFHSDYARDEGVYLWVIKDRSADINYIHYVGETTCFAKRQKEHAIQILGLNYQILDPESAVLGKHVIVWNGMWRDKSMDAIGRALEEYPSISQLLLEYIKLIDVFFAPTKLTNEIRKHLEGCIGWNLRNKHPDHKFFYPDDNHIGTLPNKLGHKLIITSDEEILGLDNELEI